jgi:hypothetical protein
METNMQRIIWAIEVNLPYFPAGWVPMGAIRDTAGIQGYDGLNGRQAFDRAMVALVGCGAVAVTPEENQKVIDQPMLLQGCNVGGVRMDYATL